MVHSRPRVDSGPVSALFEPDHVPARDFLRRAEDSEVDLPALSVLTTPRSGLSLGPLLKLHGQRIGQPVPYEKGAVASRELGRHFGRHGQCSLLQTHTSALAVPSLIPTSPVMMGLLSALPWAKRTAIPSRWSPPSGADP